MIRLRSKIKRVLGDTLTPVGIYLRMRDRFPRSVLLESTDYRPNQNCFTYICLDPISSFRVENDEVETIFPDGRSEIQKNLCGKSVLRAFDDYSRMFQVEGDPRFAFIANGLFGYLSYDAIQYFEEIELKAEVCAQRAIPQIYYSVFRFIIAVNHYEHQMYILENECLDSGADRASVGMDELLQMMRCGETASYCFKREGPETSNLSAAEAEQMVASCKQHIFRGDVFQIVPSRSFSQSYYGDEFVVYRALRMINPSPYLFFFDCGGYRIFGSSPEAQLVIEGRRASIHPIAGTCKRSSVDEEDQASIEALCADPKENAEHVMLVDLARNDLSKHCDGVFVERFKEVHKYSHVIHLVSKVSGQMFEHTGTVQLLVDTFPAGTLSGAPKRRAMELIDRYEKGRRGFYGGAIGYIGFNGDCNHAIMIRSFLSKQGVLYSQAGAGTVADSEPASEVQEIADKLKALQAAMQMAEEI
ncbi:MAG: anthranilate synthase component I family protein [Deltaproteobacteria bacterium]|nr:anthranilate synthase component I family protein [Deltaproteobacteria bacterium]